MQANPCQPTEEEMQARMQPVHDVLCNEDLLKLLFDHFTPRDLCCVGAICRLWRSVANIAEFWASLDFDGVNILPAQILPLLNRHPDIQALDLRGVPGGASLFREQGFPALDRVTQLTIGDPVKLTNTELKDINTQLSSLRELTLDQSSFAYAHEVKLASDSVQQVILKGCSAHNVQFHFPLMHSLSLRHSSVASFALHNCSSLRSLDLQDAKIGSRSLANALYSATELTSLNLQFQPDLCDELLRVVATKLVQLEELVLSSCGALALNAVQGFPALTSLDLSHCDSLQPATAGASLESFTQLERLLMDGCTGMTSIALNLPFLRHLSLQGCVGLTQIELRCPALEQLNLGCEAHTKLKQLWLASGAMQSLSLQGFQQLSDVKIACRNLISADLSDCNELNDSLFHYLSDGWGGMPSAGGVAEIAYSGGCGRLRHLRLERCEGFSVCELRSQSLREVSLADCKQLQTLKLPCPALQTINLEECKHLKQVDLKPVGLQVLSLGTCPDLTNLVVGGPRLEVLDLKGCNLLQQLSLDCCSLLTLDATFCTQLDSLTLSRALAGAHKLRSLVLSVCSALAPAMPPGLTLSCLQLLDLSYTNIQDMESVKRCCPALTSLNISSCRSMPASALASLLPSAPQPASPAAVPQSAPVHVASLLPSAPQPPSPAAFPVYVAMPQHKQTARQGISQHQMSAGVSVTQHEQTARQGTWQHQTSDDVAMTQHAQPARQGISQALLGVTMAQHEQTARLGTWQYQMSGDVALPQHKQTAQLESLQQQQQPAELPLTSLDVSYCNLPTQAIVDLLLQGSRLKDLAINGCAGVTDEVWEHLNSTLPSDPSLKPQPPQCAQRVPSSSIRGSPTTVQEVPSQAQGAPSSSPQGVPSSSPQGVRSSSAQGVPSSSAQGVPFSSAHCNRSPQRVPNSSTQGGTNSSAQGVPSSSALEFLSCVGCKGLRSCFLGMLPEPSRGQEGQACHQVQDWLPAACHLTGLQSLKLGLCGVRTVALALPCLTALDMNNCTDVRHLELHCPKLLTAYFQSCGFLRADVLSHALEQSCQLHALDIQHIAYSSDETQRLRKGLPALKALLQPQQLIISRSPSPTLR